jgi:hypothetical protein
LSLASSTTATPITPGTQLAGQWKIATGSVAGYRVREKLGFLPAESDAVGRTSSGPSGGLLALHRRLCSCLLHSGAWHNHM